MALMKIACLLVVAACLVFPNGVQTSLQGPTGPMIASMTKPLNDLPTTKGKSVSEIGNQTFTKLLNTSLTNLHQLALTFGMKLSPSLEIMLDTMKMKDLLNYYKGFQLIDGVSAYNFTSLTFLSHAVSFDRPDTTPLIIQSFAYLTGNQSIAAFMGMTEASFYTRNYLSDLYPKLLKILPDYINQTADAFFLQTTRVPLKYYKVLVGSPKLVDDILKYRRLLAFASIQGDAKNIQMITMKFQNAFLKTKNQLLQLPQKMYALQTMTLREAPSKCGIPSAQLNSKNILQIYLLCLNLPEDFPLLSFMPKQQFPRDAFQTSISDIAKKLNLPIETVLKMNLRTVLLDFLKSTGALQNHTLTMPIFYAAKIKEMKISDIPDMSILDLAKKLSSKSTSELAAIYNLSIASVGKLQQTSFKALPDAAKTIINIKYNMEHFYFLSMNSLITALTNKDLVPAQKAVYLQMFAVPVDDTTITGLVEIFKIPLNKILEQSVLSLLVKMSGVSKDDFKKVTKMVAQKEAILENMSLSDLQFFSSVSSGKIPAVLSPEFLNYVSRNPMLVMFFSPLKSLTGAKMPQNFNLKDMLMLNPIMRKALTAVLSKMQLSIVSDFKFQNLRSSMNISEMEFGKKSFFEILKWIKTNGSKVDKNLPPGPSFSDFPIHALSQSLKSCKLKGMQALQLTFFDLVKKCYKFPFGGELDKQLAFPDKYKPLIYDVKLGDYKKLLNLGDNFLSSTPISLWNSMNQTNMNLFVPLRNILKKSGKSPEDALKMSIAKILNEAIPSQVHLSKYFQLNKIYGPGLDFILKRPIQDLIVASGLNKGVFANMTIYKIMRKAVDLFSKDGDKCMKLQRVPNLCMSKARCVNLANSYRCRCKDGYSGDGKTCSDQCSTTKCPDDAECTNLPDTGATCRCSKRGYVMKKMKCKKIKGVMMQVTKLKFNQKYKKEYADKNSKEFKSKAAEIEDILYQSICKKIGCTAIVVTAIRDGSIVVDFNAVFASDNVTSTQLQVATMQAMNSSEMAALNPEKSTKPEARKSDACQSGMANCGENSKCKAGTDGSYSCECEKGYKKVGEECKKTGGLSLGAIVGIIVAVCLILIIIVVIIVVVRSKRRQRHDGEAKYGMVFDASSGKKAEKVHLTGESFAYGYPEEKHDDAHA